MQIKSDYDHAIEDYSRAIRLRPDYADAYYGRANIYNELGDTEKAMADFNAAIRIKPDFPARLRQPRCSQDSERRFRWGDCRL